MKFIDYMKLIGYLVAFASLALSSIVAITILLILFLWPSQPNFVDLPLGATNGEWSERAVADGRELLESIEARSDRGRGVIKGEILSERDERLMLFTDGGPHNLHTVYEVKVLYTYRGNFETGDIIEIQQISQLCGQRQRIAGYPDGYISVRYIRLPLYVGDDLIIFLSDWPQVVTLNRRNTLSFHSIQGLYRYTPLELRDNSDNWIFESVNEHNNLTLTEADLKHIREGG